MPWLLVVWIWFVTSAVFIGVMWWFEARTLAMVAFAVVNLFMMLMGKLAASLGEQANARGGLRTALGQEGLHQVMWARAGVFAGAVGLSAIYLLLVPWSGWWWLVPVLLTGYCLLAAFICIFEPPA